LRQNASAGKTRGMPTRGRSVRAFALLLCAVASWLVAPRSWADDLERIRADKKLVWGGDQEGGGPYIMPRDDDPAQVTGYEVEIAARLGEYLEVEAEFAQGNWDRMPDLLKAKKVDLVLNGYEWNTVRVETMDASIPYYVYALQLLARKNDDTLKAWDDLKKPRADGDKRKIAVLIGSAAEEYIKTTYGDAVEIVPYEGNTDSMREVETGKVDATLQDTPIASFYAPRFPSLHPVGEPVGRGYYVIYARKGERALVEAVNEALVLMIRNGDIERICTKYGIWDAQQAELASIADNAKFYGLAKAATADVDKGEMPTEEEVNTSTRKRGLTVVKEYTGIMVKAAGLTVILAVISFPIAIVIGLLIAIGRMYGPVWVKKPLAVYVEFLRGTPLMLQLYFIFFFLPEVGIQIPAFATGIFGLAVNYSAYESEIYRAGLQAIPVGQMEAALSLGMSRGMAIRRIIVPQAVRIVIPPVMNDFIALFKDTSVCSVVTLVELTKRYSVLSMSTQATIELMIMTAVLYLLMSYPMSLVSRRLEKKLGQLPATA
jgi:polar amino acid transport system substrate-binding protein